MKELYMLYYFPVKESMYWDENRVEVVERYPLDPVLYLLHNEWLCLSLCLCNYCILIICIALNMMIMRRKHILIEDVNSLNTINNCRPSSYTNLQYIVLMFSSNKVFQNHCHRYWCCSLGICELDFV